MQIGRYRSGSVKQMYGRKDGYGQGQIVDTDEDEHFAAPQKVGSNHMQIRR